MSNIIFDPFPKQQRFIESVFDPRYSYLLYGGSIRGGKSFVALATLILLCKLYPGSRWAVIRKDLQVIRKNTIPTFNKILPYNFLESYNGTDHIAYFKNGSQIFFMGENYDKDKELNRFKGLEVNGFVLEEVNELKEVTFFKCVERAGSWIIDNMPPPKILCTCNPTQNWVKGKFYDPYVNGTLEAPYYYLPASIFDNPHIPQVYIDSLAYMPPDQYRTFVEGSWEGTDEPDQLIAWTDLYAAKDECVEEEEGRMYLGVDVAGHGKDKTVIILMKNKNLVKILTYDDTSIPSVTREVKKLMINHRVDANDICVDGAGLGAGVIDELEEDGIYVSNFIGGGKVIEDDSVFNYKNIRAQAYWYLKLAFEAHEIGLITDDKVLSDLSSIHYTIEGDKQIKIESKDEIKKRVGRSPDYADALCYAVWARVYQSIRALPGVFVF